MEITTIGLDVARVAEIAVGLVALRVGGPAAVEADDAQQRQFVPHRRVELHRILAEGAVAMQADDLCRGLGSLGADREGQSPFCPGLRSTFGTSKTNT